MRVLTEGGSGWRETSGWTRCWGRFTSIRHQPYSFSSHALTIWAGPILNRTIGSLDSRLFALCIRTGPNCQ